MFQAFKHFVSELTGGHKHPSRFEEDDYRLAAAALLVHVGMIDGDCRTPSAPSCTLL